MASALFILFLWQRKSAQSHSDSDVGSCANHDTLLWSRYLTHVCWNARKQLQLKYAAACWIDVVTFETRQDEPALHIQSCKEARDLTIKLRNEQVTFVTLPAATYLSRSFVNNVAPCHENSEGFQGFAAQDPVT